jgi:hypothetical protein
VRKISQEIEILNLASLYSPNLVLHDLLVNYFWAVMLTFLKLQCSPFLSVLLLTSCFECVVTLVTDRLDSPFLCKELSYTNVKLFFSVSAQPQLLEVGSLENVGILSRTSLHLVFLFDLFFSLIFLIAIFLWELNRIELYFAAITLEH